MVSVTTTTKLTALTDLNVTLPSQLNIAIGYMEFSAMRLPAPVTGLAGMELPLNNSVLVDFSTMRILMLVIGHLMFEAARSTLSVLKIPMPMYPSAHLVKDTGLAKVDTLVSNVAQLLLFLTNNLADVYLLLLRIVKHQQLQKHLLRREIQAVEMDKVPLVQLPPALVPKVAHPPVVLSSVPNLRVVQNSLDL